MEMNRKKLAVCALIAISLLMFILAGCKEGSVSKTKEHVDTGYADVVLKLVPDPPVALKDAELTAEVRDAEGAPMRGAEVTFDLSMPGMYHGENRHVADEAEPGIYEATAIFTMGGKWLVAVEVKAPGVDVVKKFYTVAEGG